MLERLFKLKQRGTNPRTEAIAGLTTFLTAGYIIFVNPSILADAGMDKGALITVTCLVAFLSTMLMAVWANAPLMMAPGMGLNAFFAYTLVIGHGLPWQTALGVVFLSGLFFLVLTILGLRERIVRAIPTPLRLAASVGIGLFIAFIGMKNLGLITKNPDTLVQLGEMSGAVIVGLAGLIFIAVLETFKVRGSILIGVVATTIAGMLLDATAVFPGLAPFPNGFISLPPSLAPIAFQLDILGALKFSLWASIFSFMFVDLFDSLGTLLAVCREAKMEDKDGNIPALPRMLTADAVATVGGALLGTSTTTTYIESAAGVADGGRTGLTSVVTACLFLAAAFFTPLIGAVPAFATAPALIIVGIFMLRGVAQIDFYNFEEALPSFLTLILMPLTFSIATGLAFGFSSYVLLKILRGHIKQCDPVLIVIAVLSMISLSI